MKSKEVIANLLAKMAPSMLQQGFKQEKLDSFVKYDGDTVLRFGLVSRRSKQVNNVAIWVTPFVHVVFVKAKRVADAIRGRTAVHLPSVGGALGLFTPRRSLMEWCISSPDDSERVAKAIVDATEVYGSAFWNTYRTMESTIATEQQISSHGETQVHWEDMAGMYLISQGKENAIRYVSSLPDEQAGVDERHKAIAVLNEGLPL